MLRSRPRNRLHSAGRRYYPPLLCCRSSSATASKNSRRPAFAFGCLSPRSAQFICDRHRRGVSLRETPIASGATVGSSFRIILLLSAAAFVFMISTATGAAVASNGSAAIVAPTETIRRSIQSRLAAKMSNVGNLTREQKAIVDYYSTPVVRLLWVDEGGLTSRGRSVIQDVEKADEYGLRPADYDLPRSDEFDVVASADLLADAEIKVSIAVLRYARDARGGRLDPQRLSKNIDIAPELPDPNEVLESISISPQPAVYLRSFHPNQPQFEALRQKLIELQRMTTDSSKTDIKIPDGPILKLGVEHEQIALLRKRLVFLRTVGDTLKDMLFDETVLEAVKQFQTTQGALADGMVGPGTRRLLNQQNQKADGQASTELNIVKMERWIWLRTNVGFFSGTVHWRELLVQV